MKKRITIALSLLCLLAFVVALASCGHEHSFGEEWEKNETEHWNKCNADDACTETSGKAAHTFTEKSATAASCESKGSKVEVCSVCNYEKTTEIAALGHDYNEEVIAPTCVAAGVTKVTCKREGCTYSAEKDSVPALEHELSETTIEPTCENNGYVEVKCSNCDFSEKKDEKEALGHSFNEKKVEATCKDYGCIQITCANCDYYEEKDVTAKLPHTYYKEADAEEGKHFIIPADAQPTCTEKGTKYYTCQTCGTTPKNDDNVGEVDALGHQLNVVVVEPTCLKAGITEESCLRAGCTYLEQTNPTAALGHIFEKKEYDEVEAPTCTETGKGTYKCDRCGVLSEAESDTFVLDALGHDMQVSQEPWCGNKGVTEKKCSRCEESSVEPCVGEVPRHTYGEEKVAATCSENAAFQCSVCEGIFTAYDGDEKGQKTGIHEYTNEGKAVPATCISEGYTPWYCVGNCGAFEKKSIVPVASHALSAPDVDGMISCTLCSKGFVDISTEKQETSTPVCICGQDPCVCEGTSSDTEGYFKPAAPEAITDGYKKSDISIGNGVILLYSEAETEYTIKLYAEEGAEPVVITKTGTNIVVDLYAYETVVAVEIIASNEASVSFYKAV